MTSNETNQVWRTNSDLRWLCVTAENVTDGLRHLADLLDAFELEPFVTHLCLDIGDEVLTLGALTEKLKLPDAWERVQP